MQDKSIGFIALELAFLVVYLYSMSPTLTSAVMLISPVALQYIIHASPSWPQLLRVSA